MMYKTAINPCCEQLRRGIKKDDIIDQSALEVELTNIIEEFIKDMKFKISRDNHIKSVLLRISYTTNRVRTSVIKESLNLHLITIICCPNMYVLLSERDDAVDIIVLEYTKHFVCD